MLYSAILNRIAEYSNSFCKYLRLDPFILSTPVEFDRFTAIRKNATPAPGFRRDRVAGVQNCLLLLDFGFGRDDRKRYLPNYAMDLIDAAPTHLARLKHRDRQETELTESKGMKWIEIIKLRNAGKAPETLKGILLGLPKDGHPGLMKVKIYRHASWETDVSLHLRWESEQARKEGSSLGLRLSHALEEFGLVDHSIWIEESE